MQSFYQKAPLHHPLNRYTVTDGALRRFLVGAQNFALLRKIACKLVQRHKTSKASIKGRRKMAAWDDRYMEQVLTGSFHA